MGWLNSRGERGNSQTLARLQHEHEQTLARDARLHDTLKQTYEDLLLYLHVHMLYLDRTYAIFEPVPPAPDMPSEEEGIRLWVRIAAIGSADVLQESEKFMDAARAFQIERQTFEGRRATQHPDAGPPYEEFHRIRQEAGGSLKRIEALIRSELRG